MSIDLASELNEAEGEVTGRWWRADKRHRNNENVVLGSNGVGSEITRG